MERFASLKHTEGKDLRCGCPGPPCRDAGTVTIDLGLLDGHLPLLALPFRGTIQKSIAAELTQALAQDTAAAGSGRDMVPIGEGLNHAPPDDPSSGPFGGREAARCGLAPGPNP